MKVARMLVASAAAMLLAGCASTDAMHAARTPPGSEIKTDAARMAAVERAAYQRGIQLVWVNPPEHKRAPRDY